MSTLSVDNSCFWLNPHHVTLTDLCYGSRVSNPAGHRPAPVHSLYEPGCTAGGNCWASQRSFICIYSHSPSLTGSHTLDLDVPSLLHFSACLAQPYLLPSNCIAQEGWGKGMRTISEIFYFPFFGLFYAFVFLFYF